MNQKNNLPPSPFGAGTTYDGREKQIVFPDDMLRSHAVSKDAGTTAMKGVDIRVTDDSGQEREAHLRRLFTFPDASDDRMFFRTSVTEESLKDALDVYIATDSDIKEVINNFADEGYMPQNEVAAALRGDNALRFELGKHILTKLQGMQYLPSRLYDEFNIKNPNVSGYQELESNMEYASLLAIAMLDGTYKDSPGDKIYINRYGEVKNGQHRYAAQEVLGIDRIARRNREYQR